jgi:hypothetical protein
MALLIDIFNLILQGTNFLVARVLKPLSHSSCCYQIAHGNKGVLPIKIHDIAEGMFEVIWNL